MAHYASEIACAIEAVRKVGQVGVMITFTVPHWTQHNLSQTGKLLYSSWKRLVAQGNKTRKARNSKGVAYMTSDVFASFCETFNCTRRIRVTDLTWGVNSWHPHFHAIFFVDKDKVNKILDWEPVLKARWRDCVQKEIRHVMCKESPADVEKYIAKLYSTKDPRNQNDVYISRDKKNPSKPLICDSSWYICGWTADKEVTGSRRKSAGKGHLTPYDILELAYKCRHNEDNPYIELYKEFALTFRGPSFRRVLFYGDLHKLIAEYKLSDGYITLLKKKYDSEARDFEPRRIITWFTKEQWLSICCVREIDAYSDLLELARLPSAKELIETYLLMLRIDIRDNGEYPFKARMGFDEYGYEIRGYKLQVAEQKISENRRATA